MTKPIKKLLHKENKVFPAIAKKKIWEKIIQNVKDIPTYSEDPLTPKQLNFLKKNSYPEDYTKLSKEKASHLIGSYIEYNKKQKEIKNEETKKKISKKYEDFSEDFYQLCEKYATEDFDAKEVLKVCEGIINQFSG